MNNFIKTEGSINIPQINYGRFFWDMIYFFVVFLLFGNMFQGIIVDAFGGMRE